MWSNGLHPENHRKLLDQLPDFIDELRAQGYRIGVQEYLNAKSLLFKLHALGSLPEKLNDVSEWLAPLFASSPEEQRAFAVHFDEWLARLFPPPPPEVIPERVKTPMPEPEGEVEIQKPAPWWSRVTPYRRQIAFGAIAVTVIAVAILVRPDPGPTEPNQNANVNVNSSPSSTPTPDETPTESPTPVEPGPSPEPQPQYGYASLLNQTTEPIWTTGTAPEPSWTGKNFFWILGTATALPLALFAAWWGWNFFRRRVQLQRWNSTQKPRLDRIPVEGVRNKIFHGGSFRRLARELRRHRRLHSNRLDIRATVGATTRRGGLFTPVYGKRRALPEYLVLIDRVGYKDQQANYDSEIVNRLLENDVFIDRYFFQGDPNWCREAGPESPQRSLQDLAGRYPDHHLLVFSDGEGLINPLTGQPQEWLKSLSQWRARALLTPLPVLDWSYREWVLGRSDFTVVPASLKGMQHLVESISAEGLIKRPPLEDSRPYPALLEQKPELWAQRDEPSQINKLCAQLKRFLDDPGYNLLCACSVYPNLQWDLTLYLAFQLMTREEIDRSLASLVRLPWLRHGFMPEWLRHRLIADLGEEREQVVRGSLQDLLLTYLKNPQRPVPLTFASELTARDRGVIDKLRERLADWWKWRKLRRYIKAAPDRNLLHDEVFLNFISRSKLALAIPKLLRRYFLREGRWQLGMRSLPVFSLSMLAAAMIAITLLLARPVEAIPPMNQAEPKLPKGSEIKYTPIHGLNGVDVPLVVSNSSTESFDFSGTTFAAPGGSGLTIDNLKAEREQLSATVRVGRHAKDQQVELTLVDANGKALARLPFAVGKVSAAQVSAPRSRVIIQFFNEDSSLLRETVQYRITPTRPPYWVLVRNIYNGFSSSNSDVLIRGTYRLRVSNFVVVSSDPPVMSTSEANVVMFNNPANTDTFQMTVYLRRIQTCGSAPSLGLTREQAVNEGTAVPVEAILNGLKPDQYRSADFGWTAMDDLGRPQAVIIPNASMAQVTIDTKGLANKTITISASVNLAQFGFPGCVGSASTRIFVMPSTPPAPGTPTPTPTASVAQTESPHGAVRTRLITIGETKKLLQDAGYYKGSIDEEDSPEFREAIKKFQQSVKSPADGLLGPVTLQELKDAALGTALNNILTNPKMPESFTVRDINNPRLSTKWKKTSITTWRLSSFKDSTSVDLVETITVEGEPGTLLRDRKSGLEYFITYTGGKSDIWVLRTREKGGRWSDRVQMTNVRLVNK